jgi:hypothetical protein
LNRSSGSLLFLANPLERIGVCLLVHEAPRVGVAAETTVVITDANVLINFVHIGRVALLGELPTYRFQLPAEVMNELVDEQQRAQIEAAIASRQLDLMVIESMSCERGLLCHI